MSVSLGALLLAAAVPAVLYFLLITRKPQRNDDHGHGRRRLPPSPRSLPLLGHLHLLGPLPHRALRSLATAHGPVMLLRLGRVPTVIASSAAAAEEAMRARDLDFASRPRSAVADRLLYGGRDVAFAPYGERWRQARRVCTAHLLSARRVGSFRRVREQEAAALVARVVQEQEQQEQGVLGLGELLAAYANAVVSRAAFGDESARGLFGGEDVSKRRELVEAVAELHHLLGAEPMGELLPWLAWVDTVRGLEGRFRRTFEALDGALEKVIDDHCRRPPPHDGGDGGDHWDFVDVLLDVGKNDEYGIRLETAEIKAIILDMFAAGTNTTNTAMEWAMAELITHPVAMRRLQDEIRDAVGSSPGGSGSVSEDHLSKLPYLEAVMRETLRLHVPAPLLVPRETLRDTELLGYHVPARTRVLINAWAINRDPAAWGGGRRGVRAGEVPGQQRRLPGAGLRAAALRRREERVPRGRVRRAHHGAGAGDPALPFRLGAGRREGARHERGERNHRAYQVRSAACRQTVGSMMVVCATLHLRPIYYVCACIAKGFVFRF
ncbi:unnamed protein product [Urochloa decumbens]|uniref:Cytochrome P450 n=1 Tax=Urochloa decumbens TaxID=240449 RepID=A0ABC8Y5U4_9POAL